MTRTAPRWALVILATLLGLAALVRVRGLGFGLPFTQARPDETFVIDAARALLSGRLPQFYDYPWLYIFMVSIGYVGYFVWGAITGTFHSVVEMIASWPTYWEPFFLIPRAISAASGTLTVAVVYRLGRQIRDEMTGLVSALFLTFAFIHVRDSHFGTTDITMTLFIVAAVSLLLDAHQSGDRRLFALAGLVAGLAAATKYNAVILLAPMAVAHAFDVFDARSHRRAALVDARLLFMAVPFLVAFGVGMPFVLLDWDRFVPAMEALVTSMKSGDPRLGLQNGWLHHLEFSLRYGLGLPLLGTGIAGAALMVVRQPRIGAIVLAFPIVYYIVAGSIRNLFFRYAIPVVPFLCVSAAYLVCWGAAAVVGRWRVDPNQRVLRIATAAIAIALALPSVAHVRSLDRLLYAADNRVVVARWVEQQVPPGSSLLQSGSRFGHVRLDLKLGYREWRWDGSRNAFLLNGVRPTGRPDWIIVQDSPLPSATQAVVKDYLREGYTQVSQFAASPLDPDIVYDREDAFFVPFTGLDRIERAGPNFTVYRRDDATSHARDDGPAVK